jgi:hypothetical protein
MQHWWLEIAPGRRWTRAVLMNEAGQCVLQGRLPYRPQYPEAPRHLCEALALWCCEGTFTLVLAVVGVRFFATQAWSEAFSLLCRPPRCEIQLVERPRRADFANIERQLRAIVRRV